MTHNPVLERPPKTFFEEENEKYKSKLEQEEQ